MKNICTAFMSGTILACSMASLAGAELRQVDLKPFSEEGRLERITVRLDRPVERPFFLEVYEFHPMMSPHLALPEDLWTHKRQMEHMRQVRAGERFAYRPDSRDPKLQEILRTVQPRSYPMQSLGDAAATVSWKAAHGRIYFRFRIGEQPLAPVYSMRVHCRHADMRNVEGLKQALQGLELPLRHQNPAMASMLLAGVEGAFRKGHGLRYMMTHHDEDPSRLENSVRQLKASIAEARWPDAQASLEQLADQVRSAERLFRQADIRRDGPAVQVSLADRTGFAYADDPATEVYLRQAGSGPSSEHPPSMPGSSHDHGAGIDRAQLTAGAVRLHLKGEAPVFLGTVPENWERLEVVVLYGDGQRYFWRQENKRH